MIRTALQLAVATLGLAFLVATGACASVGAATAGSVVRAIIHATCDAFYRYEGTLAPPDAGALPSTHDPDAGK